MCQYYVRVDLVLYSSGDGDFRRPRGVYTPPPKRQRTSSSTDTLSHDTAGPRGDRKQAHGFTQDNKSSRHTDRHSKHCQYTKSHDQRRRSYTHLQQDPAKWTKYDLRDDGTEQLAGLSAEQANRKVAYQFLNQLKKSNQPEEDDLQDTKDTKIVFKRPTRSKDAVEKSVSEVNETGGSKERQNDVSAVTSVRVMPEYVVGVSGGRKRKTESGRGSNTDGTNKASIVLSHLEEECDNL